MATSTSSTTPVSPPSVEWTRKVEETEALDRLVRLFTPVGSWFVADPARRDLLRGAWLGHAVHPPLTDVPIGLWTSAVVLDLVGGKKARPAAQRLVGLGVLAAGPTAWTGWAEWAGRSRREQRVGALHAVWVGATIVGFAASWRARRRGDHARGVLLGLASSATMTTTAFLGGHLAVARKVGSRDEAFEDQD
jgi:uncharacterized membrane protein